MKISNVSKIALSMVVGGFLLTAGPVFAHGGGQSAGRGSAYNASSQLSAEAVDALLEALTGPEGEYAAYAVYDAVIKEYGQIEPYLSIREAEASHIAALQRQLDRYGIDYPKENPYLGNIEAPGDLEAFAEAGVAAEIANVEMYDQLLSKVADYPSIVKVFENLRAASQDKHKPIFEEAAANGGSLTPAQMRAVGGQHGKGGNGNSGRGKGGGHGQKNNNQMTSPGAGGAGHNGGQHNGGGRGSGNGRGQRGSGAGGKRGPR